MSARISGHALRGEGAGFDSAGERIWPPDRGLAHGKCECGELSPPVLTNAQRKRWHKWHKDQVATTAAEVADRAARTFELSNDQLVAVRALLGLVHLDDLAESWLSMLPEQFQPERGGQG